MRRNEEIVEIIIDRMVQMNLSMSELARRVGTAKSALSRYLNKEREFPLNKVNEYANALNITPEYILGFDKEKVQKSSHYSHFDTPISAGLPDHVEAVTDVDKIEIPDSIMGKHAGQKDIFITKVNGESMNRIIPDCSLIAVKPIDIHQIKQGDIVVYSDNGDYSVKRFYKNDDQLIFRPDSNDDSFFDYITSTDNPNLKIHGKVVVYIVELD